MLKLVGNFTVVVMLVMLGSCLKRPEKRAPRLDLKGNPSPATPLIRTCSASDVANKGDGAVRPSCSAYTPKPNDKTDTTDETNNPNNTPKRNATPPENTTPEPLEDDVALATISVNASCDEDSDGCLYSKDGNEKYWLKCEIKAGGCGNGFLVEAKTDTGGLPQIKRGIVCRDGNKTVAELNAGKIKLECKTDRDVLIEFAPKKTELVLNKNHLEGNHICVITDAATSNAADFGAATFRLAAGSCPVPDENQIRFNMLLEFSW